MERGSKFELHAPEKFNNAKLVGVFTDGSSEWHEARADGLGGSEVGAALGLSEWESPYSLWSKKTGKVLPEEIRNWPIRFGKAFEDPILELWQEEHPEYTVYKTDTYMHGDDPFLRANPDAIAQDPEGNWIVIEVKTSRNYWEETPAAYRAQVMHYLDVLGIEQACLVAVAGMNYYEDWIEYDKFEADSQRSALEWFWKMVVEDTPPKIDGSDATFQAVRKSHPDIDPDLEVEIEGLHHLANLNSDFELAKESLMQAKSEVLASMGKAKSAYFTIDGRKFTIATRQSKAGGAPYLVIRKGR